MLRSLFTGVSGLKAHQTMLDVTGNNISNVNTNGFKSSTIQFQDTLSQMMQGSSAPNATSAGTNPAQVGLGVRSAGISTNFGQGSTQVTGRSLDMLIDGDGFFAALNGNEKMYTRQGSFTLDAEGTLTTLSGQPILGVGDAQIRIAMNDPVEGNLTSFSIGKDGILTGVYSSGNRVALGQLQVVRFPNPGGLEKGGGSLYRSTTNSGTPLVGTPGAPGFGGITTGALEMSNVDLATEFSNMIIAQRGFQANSKIITTSDEILQELVNMKR